MTADRSENINVRIDSEMLRAMKQRADDHERTLAQEVRFALRMYLGDGGDESGGKNDG